VVRAADQAAELERQEKLLAMVSTTLTKQTSKALDASIRSESVSRAAVLSSCLIRVQSGAICCRRLAS
jgi:hypothetical protein